MAFKPPICSNIKCRKPIWPNQGYHGVVSMISKKPGKIYHWNCHNPDYKAKVEEILKKK